MSSWPPPLFLAGIYLMLTVIVLAPIFAVQVPCLGDYLGHLARIHILVALDRSAALQQFYDPHRLLVPYLCMDVVVGALTPWLGIYNAGRVFVAMCVVLPVAATAALHYAVHRRVSRVPLLGFLISYNFLLSFGFLTYLFAACWAVLLFAGWFAAQAWPRWRRAAIFAVPATALYMGHIFAFMAYGLMVAGLELGRAWRETRPRWGTAVLDVAAAAAQSLPALLLAYALRANVRLSGYAALDFGSIASKLSVVLSPIFFPALSPATGAFLLLPPIFLIMLRHLRMDARLWPALLVILLVGAATPRVLLNVWGADFRLPLVGAMLLIGGLSAKDSLGHPARAGLLALILGLVGLRAAFAWPLRRALDSQVAELRQMMSVLPVGSRLLVADGPLEAPDRVAPDVMTHNIAMVASIDHDAFVPFLALGVTSLQILPAIRDASQVFPGADDGRHPPTWPTVPSRNVAAITVPQLWEGFDHSAPNGPLPLDSHGGQMYWLGWPAKFDYVLVTHFGAATGPLPPDLRRVASCPIADLYQVIKG